MLALLLLPLACASPIDRPDADAAKSSIKVASLMDDISIGVCLVITAVHDSATDDSNFMAVFDKGEDRKQVGDYITPQWDDDKGRFVTTFPAGDYTGVLDLEFKDGEIGPNTRNNVTNAIGHAIGGSGTCTAHDDRKGAGYVYAKCWFGC